MKTLIENQNKLMIDTSVSVLKPNKGHWENGNPICPDCGEDRNEQARIKRKDKRRLRMYWNSL